MLSQIIALYERFLALFPTWLHFWLSLAIFLFLALWLLKLVKKSLIWLLLLVIFVPTSIPLLKQIFSSALEFLKFLLSR